MKPISLSALNGVARAMDRGNFAGMAAARDALPVLIEIAKAALTLHEQHTTNNFTALTMTAEEIVAENIEVRRAYLMRRAALARTLETALKAVRP
jgi:hypothetical protein